MSRFKTYIRVANTPSVMLCGFNLPIGSVYGRFERMEKYADVCFYLPPDYIHAARTHGNSYTCMVLAGNEQNFRRVQLDATRGIGKAIHVWLAEHPVLREPVGRSGLRPCHIRADGPHDRKVGAFMQRAVPSKGEHYNNPRIVTNSVIAGVRIGPRILSEEGYAAVRLGFPGPDFTKEQEPDFSAYFGAFED